VSRSRVLVLVARVASLLLAWWLASSSRRDRPTTDATAAGASSVSSPDEPSATVDSSRSLESFGLSSGFVAPRETVRDERTREQLQAALARVFASAFDGGAEGRADERRRCSIASTSASEFAVISSRWPRAATSWMQSRRPGFGG
jgi:hypothetical protein